MLPVHHISGEAENGVALDADSPMTADSDGTRCITWCPVDTVDCLQITLW